MSLIWFILVNTIIGMVLFPIEIQFIIWYADKKYGIDVTEEVLDDNTKNVEDFSVMSGIKYEWLLHITYILNFILWEIFIPINIVLNLARIKDLHEIRGGDDRMVIRRRDREINEMKESIKSLTRCVQSLMHVCEQDAEAYKVLKEITTGQTSSDSIENTIKFHKELIDACKDVIDNVKERYNIKI